MLRSRSDADGSAKLAGPHENAAGNSSADPGENAVGYFGRPYDCDGEIRFDHRWAPIVGTTEPRTGSESEI